MYKKLLSILTVCALALTLFSGCSSEKSGEPEKDVKQSETNKDNDNEAAQNDAAKDEAADIHIACMKGPTAIGMIKLLSDSDNGSAKNRYHYTITGTADEISTGLVNGSLDIAAVPCNLASVLYNNTKGEIVTAAINTLGVLYIVEGGETIQNVSDLKGKTLYSTGQGTTPEYTLRYLLTKAGLDPEKDVAIEYKSEAADVVSALTQNPEAAAVLPQPYVTIARMNNDKLRIALDITKEWEAADEKSTVITGVIVARKSFIEEHPDAFKNFLAEYSQSTQFANSNIDETAALLEQFDIFKAAVAKQAIPYCNVTFIDGKEMQEKMLSYLTILYQQNPASIGGKLPEEGIFYLEDK